MHVEIEADRLGKAAMLIAMSSKQEEEAIRASLEKAGKLKVAVSWISGLKSEISRTFSRSIVNTALKAQIIQETPDSVHALIHAGIEALGGLVPAVTADSSLKVKVVIALNSSWIAVAAYGDSAFMPETNHERLGLGIMHLSSSHR